MDIPPVDKTNSLWYSLTQEERVYLRENAVLQTFRKNQFFYCCGDEPKNLVCLISGMAKIYKDEIGMNHQQIIRLAKAGDIFAYRAFLAKENHRNNAVALEISQAYLVPLRVLEQIMHANCRFAMALMQALAKKLGDADFNLAMLTQKNMRERMAQIIILLKNNFGFDNSNNLHAKLSRIDLAYLSNMTTSNAIRTLSNFIAEQLISVDKRTIKILNEEKLKKIAQM